MAGFISKEIFSPDIITDMKTLLAFLALFCFSCSSSSTSFPKLPEPEKPAVVVPDATWQTFHEKNFTFLLPAHYSRTDINGMGFYATEQHYKSLMITAIVADDVSVNEFLDTLSKNMKINGATFIDMKQGRIQDHDAAVLLFSMDGETLYELIVSDGNIEHGKTMNLGCLINEAFMMRDGPICSAIFKSLIIN